jgi:hypothetical protein
LRVFAARSGRSSSLCISTVRSRAAIPRSAQVISTSVVTEDVLSDKVVAALGTMRARLATGLSKWARELEVSYPHGGSGDSAEEALRLHRR